MVDKMVLFTVTDTEVLTVYKNGILFSISLRQQDILALKLPKLVKQSSEKHLTQKRINKPR